jgi:hypothetical protein
MSRYLKMLNDVTINVMMLSVTHGLSATLIMCI